MISLLPPCVEALLPLVEQGDAKATEIVAAYMKNRVSVVRIYEDLPNIADKIVATMNKPNLTTFSCQLVYEKGHADKCDQTRCPYFAARDPVGFILDQVERVTYNPTTKTLKLYFPNARRPLQIPVAGSIVNRAEVEGNIKAFMLEYSNVSISLRPYKDEDTGIRRDPLDELITQAYHMAEPLMEDEYGVGEVLIHIIQTNVITPTELATVTSDVFVYVNKEGAKYLAISPKLMRTVSRQLMGIASIKKLTNLLSDYGIEKRRLRLHGERAYFYLVPASLFERLTGEKLEDYLNPGRTLDVEALYGGE